MTRSPSTSKPHSSEPPDTDLSLVARLLRSLIRLYQTLRSGRPSPCRFYPSCSQYALEAVETHGAAKGAWLTVRRLSKCHPLGSQGVDLVPEPKKR